MSDSLTRRARDAFSEWLGSEYFRWASFGTYTFRDAPGSSCIQTLFSVLKRASSPPGRPGAAFIAEEIGPRGGRRHLHALCESFGRDRSYLKRVWEYDYGFARVRQYDSARGAAHYVTKYIIKDSLGLGDYRLYTPSEFGADSDLFEPGMRTSGYQLYTAWRHLQALGG